MPAGVGVPSAGDLVSSSASGMILLQAFSAAVTANKESVQIGCRWQACSQSVDPAESSAYFRLDVATTLDLHTSILLDGLVLSWRWLHVAAASWACPGCKANCELHGRSARPSQSSARVLTTASPCTAYQYHCLDPGAENQKLLEQTADIQRETAVTCSGFRTLHDSGWSVSCQALIASGRS